MMIIAIVIPSCGGKTTLSNMMNVYDIDIGALNNQLGVTVQYINELAIKGLIPWHVSTTIGSRFIKYVLDTVNDEVVCVLLHSYDSAVAVGADKIVACIPTKQLHALGVANRGIHTEALAKLNLASIVADTSKFDQVMEYSTYVELQGYVCNITNMPILNKDDSLLMRSIKANIVNACIVKWI